MLPAQWLTQYGANFAARYHEAKALYFALSRDYGRDPGGRQLGPAPGTVLMLAALIVHVEHHVEGYPVDDLIEVLRMTVDAIEANTIVMPPTPPWHKAEA